MVTRLMAVDDHDDEDRDESDVPRRDRAECIKGPERYRLVLALAAKRKTIGQIGEEFDRAAQTISNFKCRNKREIQEMERVLMEKTADLFFAEQHHRINAAERHLLLIDDQLREMQEAADREEDPVPLDLKEFRGLMAEANKIRREIREEMKPTIGLGELQLTPPKRYGFDVRAAFENQESGDA